MNNTFVLENDIEKEIESEVSTVCDNKECFTIYKMPNGKWYKEDSKDLWDYVRDYE